MATPQRLQRTLGSFASMRLSRGLAVVTLLVAVTAVAVLAQAPVTERGFVPTDKTVCWDCHGGGKWNPPLKEFGGITPKTIGGPVGSEFKATAQLRALWTPKGSDPLLQNTTATIDLTNAPSLRFGGEIDDQNEVEHLAMALNPQADPGSTTVTTSHKFQVDSGTTSLEFQAVPDAANQALPPNIVLAVKPPAGDTRIVDEAGPGQAEVASYDVDTLAAMPPGNWTLTVSFEAVAVDGGGGLPVLTTNLNVDVTKHAAFDLKQLRRLVSTLQPEIRAGGVVLQSWPLVAQADPAPGETVALTFQGQAYYDHSQYGIDKDIADFLKVLDVPVEKQGDEVVLVFESKAFVAEIQNGPTMATISEAVGYASTFLLVSSIWSGGMFGMASRRQLNRLFVSAKRRVAFHNFLSYGLMLGAAVHLVLFLIEEEYRWTQGMTLGNLGLLSMLLLGVTGALQVQLIKRWGYAGWRWTHYGLAVGAIVFTVAHAVLDGVHFGEVQKFTGYEDPFTELVFGD